MTYKIGDAIKFEWFYSSSGVAKTGLLDVKVKAIYRNDVEILALADSPTVEVGDGFYSYTLAGAFVTAAGVYTAQVYTADATVDMREMPCRIDVDAPTFPAGATEYTYTITNSITGFPIDGIEVWISTDALGGNIIWKGETDAFGIARDVNGVKPWLDNGTYYFWQQLAGYVFVNPHAETIPPAAGGTTGTPITMGAPVVAGSLDQALPPTLLSLSTWAKIMGIAPAHFWGASGETLTPPIFPVGTCSDIWQQYAWQDGGKTSRFDIALKIQEAEEEVARFLGYYPAPYWIMDERHTYPRPYRPEYYGNGSDVRGLAKSIKADFGKIVDTGRRTVTLIGSPSIVGGSLVYSDDDGDGMYETATLAVATALTDVNELKVYHSGHSGDIEWEIREPRRKYASAGVVTMIFDSWLFIDPTLYEAFPDDTDPAAINLGVTTNFVNVVDVYREFANPADEPCLFQWENAYVGCAVCGGVGCEACGTISQDACLRIRDHESGLLVPLPASYSATTGEWTMAELEGDREPDKISIWYRSGAQSREYIRQKSSVAMPLDLAQAISWIVSARLDSPICSCSNPVRTIEKMQIDMSAISGQDIGFFSTTDIVSAPFGTRRGEIMAWRKLAKLMKHNAHGFAV